MLDKPAQGRIAVFGRGWERKLGRKPVVDGRDDTAGVEADVRTLGGVEDPIDRAVHESTAVDVQEDRVRTDAERAVDPKPDRAAVDRYREVLHLCDRLNNEADLLRALRERLVDEQTLLVDGKPVAARADRLVPCEKLADLCWKRHRTPSGCVSGSAAGRSARPRSHRRRRRGRP